jgi:DNA-binding response OmpR family regulator
MVTVLLAEDDADIRFLVTLKLTQAGYQVRGFGDGLSAAADAREHPPDLAILDIMMPGMSGLEVCRELRKVPATAKIPVIMLTALAHEADIKAGLAAGADDYIVKPFNTRDFTTRVNAVLARVQANGARPSEFARSNPDPPDLVPPNVTPPALVQPNLAPPALVQPNLAPPDQASPSGGG